MNKQAAGKGAVEQLEFIRDPGIRGGIVGFHLGEVLGEMNHGKSDLGQGMTEAVSPGATQPDAEDLGEFSHGVDPRVAYSIWGGDVTPECRRYGFARAGCAAMKASTSARTGARNASWDENAPIKVMWPTCG